MSPASVDLPALPEPDNELPLPHPSESRAQISTFSIQLFNSWLIFGREATSFRTATQSAEREDVYCGFFALSVNGKVDCKWQEGNKWCRTFQHPSQINSTRHDMPTFPAPKTISTYSFCSGAVSALLMCFSVHSSSPDRGSKSSPPSARPPSAAILSPRSEYLPEIWLVQNGWWHWLTGGWMNAPAPKPQRPRTVRHWTVVWQARCVCWGGQMNLWMKRWTQCLGSQRHNSVMRFRVERESELGKRARFVCIVEKMIRGMHTFTSNYYAGADYEWKNSAHI